VTWNKSLPVLDNGVYQHPLQYYPFTGGSRARVTVTGSTAEEALLAQGRRQVLRESGSGWPVMPRQAAPAGWMPIQATSRADPARMDRNSGLVG
jgi:hypothetical protein